ncbi:MAG TPA: hypothetical protein VM618_08060 [Acidimicrobiia bacterium]|nr:hypothetical protein [Acidimicrobiia bacterium]
MTSGWRGAALLFVAATSVFAASPVVTNGDSFLVGPTAHSLLHERDLDIDEHLGPATDGGIAYVADPDGPDPGTLLGAELPRNLPSALDAYDYFPWVTAVLVTPLTATFDVAGAVGIDALDPDRMLARGETGALNLAGASLLTAGAVVAMAVLAWQALGALEDRRRRLATLAVAVVTALGTPAWSTLSRALWNQTVAVLFLSLAVLVAFRVSRGAASPRRLGLLLGATVAAAYTARPTSAVAVVAFGVWLLARHRRALVGYLAGGVAVAVPWTAVNLATFGSVFPPYHSAERAGLRDDTFEALAANLVSPNRGLLVFTPIVVVSIVGAVFALRERGPVTRPLAVTAVAIALVHLVVVSAAGEAWWAGSAYGPRFMADLLPVLVLLALPAVERLARPASADGWRRAALAAAIVSVVMHLPGAWSKPAQCWNLDPVPVDVDPSRVWHWDDLQAWRPMRVLLDTGSPQDAVFQRCDDLLQRRPGPEG